MNLMFSRIGFKSTSLALLALAMVSAGCGHDDDGHDHGNEEGVITTVRLTFTPTAGGANVVASFNDPDGDGGSAPTVDPITLPAGAYSLAAKFENGLETPPVDITAEISDEAEEHQVFLLGTAVSGPASTQAMAPLTHSYADTDANGLPVGLANTIAAAAGTGTLTVVLRHLPPVNGMPVKVANLATTVSSGGLAAIGGSSDVEVNFPVTVTP